MGKGKNRNKRFRRTPKEISAGLTIIQAIEARKNAPKKKTKKEKQIEKEERKEKRRLKREQLKKELKAEKKTIREMAKEKKLRQKRIQYLGKRIQIREEAIKIFKVELDKLENSNQDELLQEGNSLTRWKMLDCDEMLINKAFEKNNGDNGFKTRITVVVARIDGEINILATSGEFISPGEPIAQLVYKDIGLPNFNRKHEFCIELRNLMASFFQKYS